MITGLDSNRFDIIMSAFADKPSYYSKYDFVDYLGGAMSLLVQKGDPKHIATLNQLCGQTAMTVQGSTNEIAALNQASKHCQASGKKPINVQLTSDEVSARLAVRQGRATGYLTALAANGYSVKKSPDMYAMVGPLGKGETHGIVVPKDDIQLRKALTAAVNQIMVSGQYLKILKRWGAQKIALPKVTINQGTVKPLVKTNQ